MARPNSRDLRDRVVGSMSATARAGRPRAIRGERGQRGEAVAALARDRQRGGQADERLAAAALAERAGVSVGAVGREAGSDPGAGVLAALRHDRITAPCVTDDRSMAPSFALMSSNSCGPLEPRRHCRQRQSRQPQGHGGAPPDPRRRAPSCSSCPLLARPQPDRAGLRKAQDPVAPTRALSRPLGAASARSSTASLPWNAPITSPMPAMLPPNRIALYGQPDSPRRRSSGWRAPRSARRQRGRAARRCRPPAPLTARGRSAISS